jgi:hypothetical protein
MGMRGPGARPMKERKLRPKFLEREKALKVLACQSAPNFGSAPQRPSVRDCGADRREKQGRGAGAKNWI